MTENLLQWIAIIIEFIGLVLIMIELYFPTLSENLKELFEGNKNRIKGNPKIWISSYIFVWIIAVIGLTAWDESMSFVANIFFTVFTVLIIILLGISRMFVRLGVVLGRGNSVGGVGLVLALIGLSIEVIQLVLT